MFDRRLAQNFDWLLLIIILLIVASGLMTLYSAARAGLETTQSFFFKQLLWYCLGIMVMISSFLIHFKRLDYYAYAGYFLCIILLVAVIFAGKYVAGARRWLVFGPITLQPSELAKLGVIVVLARYYSRSVTMDGLRLRDLILPALMTLVPFLLIAKQPDLGTAMMILLIAATMTVFAKIEKKALIAIMSIGLICIPMTWFLLKEYQKRRIMTFLEPDMDPLGAGYHILQSKIAIGSGMLSGKGFLKGTQNALSFLPEHHTDFIFSVLAEDWGFIGSAAVIFLFIFLITWCLNIAHNCKDQFGIFLVIGITALIGWEVFINIGMVMGLMPVVGIPLPFISYGGSAVITKMLCIGILMSISMRRFLFEQP